MRLKSDFYQRDALIVAPGILGKTLVRRFSDSIIFKDVITEVEIYRGEDDLACHANKGKTERTKVMYEVGGCVYVYFVYGMYWLLNIVAGLEHKPQAVLIRSLRTVKGPGRIGRVLKLDKSFYGENLVNSKRIWLEESGKNEKFKIRKHNRVGVAYAGKWANKKWRLEAVFKGT